MRNSFSYLPLASGLLVLVLALGVAVLTVTSRNSSNQQASTTSQNVTTKAAEDVPSLSLSPAKANYTYTAGQSYTLGIILDSAGKTIDGVDVIINFDPTRAQVIDSKVNTASLFEQYPLNSVDNTKGKIRFSGLTFNPKPVTGIIGTFRFQSLGKGEVNFSFDFTLGATTDSNIAEHGSAKDVLGKVTNGTYFFK